MSGQQMFEDRKKIKHSLELSLDKAYKNGIEMAEKTMDYRISLRQEIMGLRADGIPVSIIDKLAKGEPSVARAEFDMIVAEVKYKASNENIMAQKKFLESIEADIKREYYRGE